MIGGAILHGDPQFLTFDERSSGALGYAADVFAAIAGADLYAVRTFFAGLSAVEGDDDAECAALLRDLQLRDEPLPTLVSVPGECKVTDCRRVARVFAN